MLTKISISLKNFQIRNFKKRIPTFVKAVTWNFLKKFGWKKKTTKLLKDIRFAICTLIGSYVNEKEKKIVKIQDFKFKKKKRKEKKKKKNRPEIRWIASYLSTTFDVYSPHGFWERQLNRRHHKQWPKSVYYNLWLYTTRANKPSHLICNLQP